MFQCDIRIAFSKYVLLQFELAMLNGRDGDAVDVADSAIADAQTREQTQADVVFLHIGVLLAKVGKAVVVDGIECTLYLAPLVGTEIDERIAALVEFINIIAMMTMSDAMIIINKVRAYICEWYSSCWFSISCRSVS